MSDDQNHLSDDQKTEKNRSFLLGRIDSIEQLHVLILLRDGGEKVWTVPQISEELRSTPSSVELRIRHLIDRQVLAPEAFRDRNVHYRPFDSAVEISISDLVTFYREKPYRVIDMIFSQPRSAIHSFANAFKFRKD